MKDRWALWTLHPLESDTKNRLQAVDLHDIRRRSGRDEPAGIEQPAVAGQVRSKRQVVHRDDRDILESERLGASTGGGAGRSVAWMGLARSGGILDSGITTDVLTA